MRNGQEVKLDPEERILAPPDDEDELGDANERGAGARIEGWLITIMSISSRTGSIRADLIRWMAPRLLECISEPIQDG